MNNLWDKYVDARNNLARDLIKAGIDITKLSKVEIFYKEYLNSCKT